MSAAIKFATLASGLTLFSASALYSFKRRQQDFSGSSLALEHTLESEATSILKPKLPSNFVTFTIGGYEIKGAA